MARCVYSVYGKEYLFEYKRHLCKENGDLMPTSFEFETSEANTFQYFWQIEYSLQSKETQPAADGNESVLGEIFHPEDEEEEDEDEEDNEGDARINEDEDLNDEDASIKKKSLHGFELSVQEKLIAGDTAYVQISVNDVDVCFEGYLDSDSSRVEKRTDLDIKNCCESQMHIKIKIYHQDQSVDQMIENYRKLLDSKKQCDITFYVGDKKIPAHSQVLSARSVVFASMFESDMLEKNSGRVEITDIDQNTFKMLLQFVYYGRVVCNEFYDWLKLIVASDKYSVTSLVKICDDHIVNNLSIENVIDVYITADLISASVLKEKCIEFIFANKRQVVETDVYKNLLKTRANLANEILSYILEKL